MLISFDDNQLFAFPVRNIYILDWDVDKRLYFSHLNGYLLTGFVAHNLSLNLQRAWCDTENQDTTVSVEEGTKRMHGVFKFASGLLQFKCACLAFGNNAFDEINSHVNKCFRAQR